MCNNWQLLMTQNLWWMMTFNLRWLLMEDSLWSHSTFNGEVTFDWRWPLIWQQLKKPTCPFVRPFVRVYQRCVFKEPSATWQPGNLATWELLETFGSFWQLLAAFGNFWRDQLNGPAERTSRTDQLDGPGGRMNKQVNRQIINLARK